VGAATGKPVGKPIFVLWFGDFYISRMPAQPPIRVTKKEPDIYDIEVVPRGLCVTAAARFLGSSIPSRSNASLTLRSFARSTSPTSVVISRIRM
jgi:hypothetical protein